MGSVQVRRFRRDDREQLTALVNAHIQAVVPGVSVSVNAVLSQLEREPGEFIVDPWVIERATLVAEQRGRITAATHVLRYGTGSDVGEAYRGAGEIRWLLCWPEAPYWPDAVAAGDAIAAAAVSFLSRSRVRRLYADGALPAPGVFGLPDQWPHIRAILQRAGFVPGSRVEMVFLADVEAIDRPAVPIADLTIVRTLGVNGTRLSAVRDREVLGYVEVESRLGDVSRAVRQEGWADVGNFCVEELHRRRGIGSWLLGQTTEWLRLGHIDRLLAYATTDDLGYVAFLRHAGFRELTQTTRGWESHQPATPHRET
jgi:GNAT superfamily N-acetyltransferase